MANYFVSDMHGEYELFCRLLESIDFNGSDTLFVLGDFLDKGNRPVKLANLLSSMKNVRAICGNHEYFFLSRYHDLMQDLEDGADTDAVLTRLADYFRGESAKITWELIDYLEALPYYFETDGFICVHAGVELNADREIIPMNLQNPNYFLFDRKFAGESVIPKNSKPVIFGHTPCHYVNTSGHFIKTPRSGSNSAGTSIADFAKIRLDNGVFYTGMLGALRLEDMREFYVMK